MRHQYIRDWATNRSVSGVYYVRSCQEKTARNGKPYLEMELQDCTGDVTARKFDTAMSAVQGHGPLEWVSVSGLVDEFKGRLQLKIEDLSRASEPANLADYKPVCPGDRNAHRRHLLAVIDSVKNRHLKALLKAVTGDEALFRRFCDAPGAVSMHNACIGGLLEHTLQVVALCESVAAAVPTLKRDLLLTGAILHDIGKTEEIDFARPVFDFTPTGALVGHVALTVDIVNRALDTLPGFPPSLRNAVTHLLLSHHGRKEWGSPVAPAIPEAFVLSECDLITARLFSFERAAEEARGGVTVYAKGLDDRVYVGPIEYEEDSAEMATPYTADWDDLARPVVQVLLENPTKYEPRDIDLAPDMVLLPIRGRIAAGQPDATGEHVEGWRAVPSQPGSDRHYLLRVTGDSMLDAHILNGDLVRVEPGKTARDKDIVVALVDGETTVKRLLRLSDGVVLHPENPEYPDIVVGSEQDLRIQGRVVGLIRETVS